MLYIFTIDRAATASAHDSEQHTSTSFVAKRPFQTLSLNIHDSDDKIPMSKSANCATLESLDCFGR